MAAIANRLTLALLCVPALVASSIAEAQWVLLARRAVGRIEQMSQTAPGSNAVFDTASVIIDAPADKVFGVVAQRIKSSPNVKVTRSDDAQKSLEFTNGAQTATIQVSVMGENLAQLLVSSASGGPPSPMPAIVDHILAACKELKVECERARS